MLKNIDTRGGSSTTCAAEACTPDRTLSVLGVSIADLSRAEALALMEQLMLIRDGRCRSLFFVNAHTLNVAADDPRYRDELNASDLVLNDGTGVRWAARQRGIELRANLNGTDLIPAFLAATAGRGYRYFMLGADAPTIAGAAAAARSRFRGWELAGYHDGYLDDARSASVIETINAAEVDLLLVGMGNPIQERWILRHRAALNVPLAAGIGGLFDFWINKPRRAPLWVRKAGCEWVHKLLLQPHKWRRYLLGNPKFIYRMTRDRASDLARMKAAAESTAAPFEFHSQPTTAADG